jgi:hypothetical protein
VRAEKGKVEGKGCEYVYTATDTVFRDIIKVGIKRGGRIKLNGFLNRMLG